MHPEDPKTLQAIKQIVLILDRGQQPPAEMDVLVAIDHEYAVVKHWPNDREGFAGLELTGKGVAAAALWRLNVRRPSGPR